MNAHSIKNKNVVLKNGFWKKKTELIAAEVIPYQWNALNDNILNAEKSFCIRNFKLAAGIINKRKSGINTPVYPTDKWLYTPENSDKNSFMGWVFQDSDLFKWIEAAAFCIENSKNTQLEALADSAVDIICNAQEESGYINTLYTINNPENKFTNLKDHHELYCFGHLAEAAVAYYNATGKNKLLNAAVKYADLICSIFGKNGRPGYGGHEIAEMALIKLYHTVNNKNYLDTAELFIKRRGTKPYYFDTERGIEPNNEIKYKYNQSHIPVMQQTKAAGHAVRAVYLYSGMADVARETENEQLFEVCKALYNNITERKMYITGGIGSASDGEAFTFDYDLPNDLAYAESCASIGLAFFAQRMLLNDFNAKYADITEKCLYNGILSGIALDGKSFFYVNPLEVYPKACNKDLRKSHIKPTRQKWFNCACCPPNIARLISSVGEYCFTETDSTVFVNQYISSEAECRKAFISIDETYIENGFVNIKIKPKSSVNIALRIPSWCSDFKFSCNAYKIENGYAYFQINEITEIAAEFKIKIKIIKCNPNVRSNIGKVAVTRGPVVYCLEEIDNSKNLHLLRLAKNPDFNYRNNIITANGFREIINTKSLYEEYSAPEEKPVRLKFIPYHSWANRGENEMCVYIRY